MKRCTRCCMPATVPGLGFGDDGVCTYCAALKRPEYLGEEKLQAIIDSAKSAGQKYDAIVPLSGGRDSTFVLYAAAATYGLRVLAVNYDNEFTVRQALTNMENACDALGVRFLRIRSQKNLARKIVLNGIRASLFHGLFITAGDACRACMYGYHSVVYRIAQEHRVPLILWGESNVEATQDIEQKATQGFKTSCSSRLYDINFYKAEWYALLHRLEFRAPGTKVWSRRPIVSLKNPHTQEIRLFDYLQWDRQQIKETIMSKLGWMAPERSVSSWRIDCSLHHLVNYCYLRCLGCTKDCFGYTKMINAGQITRAEALKQEEATIATVDDHVKEVLEDIGLSRAERERIMKVTG